MTPYQSEAQRKFFHTARAKKQGITPAMVKEFDKASKGRNLPERINKNNDPMNMLKRGMQGLDKHGKK